MSARPTPRLRAEAAVNDAMHEADEIVRFAILRNQGKHRLAWVEKARPGDLDGHRFHLRLVKLKIAGPEVFPAGAVFTFEIANSE